MRICNLASGSSGNCTYIESRNTRLLIDNGKPLSYVFNCLNELGVAPESIEAILITHEHSDHIKGIEKYARTYNTKIYAHMHISEVLLNQIHVDREQFVFFDSAFDIGDIHIEPFALPHDSKFCVGYRLNEEDAIVSVCTDLGSFSDETFEIVKSSALIFLEANYDPEMLMSYPGYPPFLKKRINGPNGHLSNLHCAKAIEKLVHAGTRLVVLSHISEHSNTINLAVSTIANYLESKNIIPNVNVRLDIAHHEKRGTIFRITPTSQK
ncbi:MAG: MBL fold metallo-hydrolase [Clostridiales bacterium]|nr:MBL fold metallo-hydrolase [Clostridiales bacterium]